MCENNVIKISDCDAMPYQINLGRQFENNVGKIIFDCSEFVSKYGTGSLQALHENSNGIGYLVPLDKISDSVYEWNVASTDTNVNGYGKVQLTYFVGDIKKKTVIIKTYVEKSLGENEVEPPEPIIPYVEKIMQIGAEVQVNRDATEGFKELAEQASIGAHADAQNAEEAAIRAEEAAERAEQAGLPTAGSSLDDVPTADGQGGWSWQQQKVKSVNGKTGNVVLNAGDVDAYNKEETDYKIHELNQYVVQELNSLDEKIDNLDIPTSLAELNQDTTHRTVSDTEKAAWNGKANESDLQEVEETLRGEIGEVENKIPTELNQLNQNTNYRTVSDSEKTYWGGKSDFSGNYNDLTNKPTIPQAYDDTEIKQSIQDLGETLTEETAVDETTIDRNNNNELQSIGNVLISGGIQKYWKGSKSQFDAITVKDDNTLYEVLDDEETALFEVDGATIEITNDGILRVPNNIDLMFQSVLYNNGESGYRKYRNGFIEQWGIATTQASETEFNLHQAHINQDFGIVVTVRELGDFFVCARPSANQKMKVRIRSSSGTAMAVKFQWRSWGRWK